MLVVVLVNLSRSQTETITEDPECVNRTTSSDLADCLLAFVSFESLLIFMKLVAQSLIMPMG
jgi:hypothetical protein